MKINKSRKNIILKMNEQQAGRLLQMLLIYEETGKAQKTDDDFVGYLFDLMKIDIDKQRDIAERRKTYSKGKGRPKKQGGAE